MDGRVGRWTDRWLAGWLVDRQDRSSGWHMHGLKDGQTHGQQERSMVKQRDRHKYADRQM